MRLIDALSLGYRYIYSQVTRYIMKTGSKRTTYDHSSIR
ncbi:hypothetical protein VDIAB_100690 [Vibrio diabolicus]|nr:hypothetical protein VDIAB_100690 [Vibrio diabolicus]